MITHGEIHDGSGQWCGNGSAEVDDTYLTKRKVDAVGQYRANLIGRGFTVDAIGELCEAFSEGWDSLYVVLEEGER